MAAFDEPFSRLLEVFTDPRNINSLQHINLLLLRLSTHNESKRQSRRLGTLSHLIDRVKHKRVQTFQNWRYLFKRLVLLFNGNVVPHFELDIKFFLEEFEQLAVLGGLYVSKVTLVFVLAVGIFLVANFIVFKDAEELASHVA